MSLYNTESAYQSATATLADAHAALSRASEARARAVHAATEARAASDRVAQRAAMGHPVDRSDTDAALAVADAALASATRAHDAACRAVTEAEQGVFLARSARTQATRSMWPSIEAAKVGELRAAWRYAAGLHREFLRARGACDAIRSHADCALGGEADEGSVYEIIRSAGLSFAPFGALVAGVPPMTSDELSAYGGGR